MLIAGQAVDLEVTFGPARTGSAEAVALRLLDSDGPSEAAERILAAFLQHQPPIESLCDEA